MQAAGFGLLVIGLAGLIGAGVYYALVGLFGSADVPLVIRISIVAVAAGFVVLIAAVIRDRIRESRSERFEEVDR